MGKFKGKLCSKKFFNLVLFVLIYFTLIGNTQVNFFSNPCFCSSEKLAQELKEKTLDMRWHFDQDCYFGFVTGNDEVYFEICLGTLPDFYDDFVVQLKDKFIEKQFEKSKALVFSYKVKNDGTEEINIPQSYERQEHPNEYSYIVTERRVVANANPKLIGQDELETIIKNDNILFYTGAGLSLASDVPAMNELIEILGIEKSQRWLYSLEAALNNPREFASKILIFHKACFYSSPTKAHFALKELAGFKNIRIITENLDCLHESSGIDPYRIDANHLRDEIGAESLAQFDYIICIGLSYDDRGFLGWYKQNNPKGKIIAVNLQQPSYLGDEDFLIVSNLQEIIPTIQRNIMQ